MKFCCFLCEVPVPNWVAQLLQYQAIGRRNMPEIVNKISRLRRWHRLYLLGQSRLRSFVQDCHRWHHRRKLVSAADSALSASCSQSVAQLTEVAAFTVLFIYSNQSMTTLVTPLLSLSSIIRGSHRDLWLNKTSHWWFGLALSRWSAQ